jgi:signal transduction histidine kinase
MSNTSPPQIEERVARCRLILSGLVTIGVLFDPVQPSPYPWVTLMGRPYPVRLDFLATILLHLLYSTVVYVGVRRHRAAATGVPGFTTFVDILFAAGITFVTAGRSPLFYPYFSLPVVASGARWGFRRTLTVTSVCAGLGALMIGLWNPDGIVVYLVRPINLMIVGYLIAYLGDQRLALEHDVRALEANEQRLRLARDLHDGCLQVLAALNLELESCQNLVRSGQLEELLAELRSLQTNVNSEHDELRAYLRSLAGIAVTGASLVPSDPHFRVRLHLDASGALIDQVLRIVREGVTNIQRHAGARAATIRAASDAAGVHILIEDDGCGFANDTVRPWSILSRVRELGGSLSVASVTRPGTSLAISLPSA